MSDLERWYARTIDIRARKAVILSAGGHIANCEWIVEAHDQAAAAGEPDPMGKPSEFVKPVGQGPYSLIAISVKRSVINPCPMFTLGGVIVDEDTGAVKHLRDNRLPVSMQQGARRSAYVSTPTSATVAVGLRVLRSSGSAARSHVGAGAHTLETGGETRVG